MRRRVPARTVVREGPGAHHLGAGKAIQERRLADAGRAEHYDRAPGVQVCRDVVDAEARDVRDRIDRHADGDRLDLEQRVPDVAAQVGLRQHHDRLGSALPGRRDVTLEPAQAEVVVEAGEQERGVDVCREHLFVRGEAGALPHEGAAAREDRRDRRVADADPVADRRNRLADFVLVEHPAGSTGAHDPFRGPHDVLTAMLRGDARRRQVVLVQFLERRRPAGVPSELIQNRQSESPL